MVRDKQKAEELWNPAYKAWFPKGLDDPDLALLKVSATQAEYWDSSSSAVVHLVGFVKALATGERYHPGENER
jgi:general stress protein 26